MKNVTCQVKQVVFGEGMPKICIPITATDKLELERDAEAASRLPCDVVEWRADYYPLLTSREQVEDAFAILRKYLADRLILFTFRTQAQGGRREATAEEYQYLNRLVILYGKPDLLDVELSAGDEVISLLLEKAHRQDVKVIISDHDFLNTPQVVEMVAILRKMQDLGADICKMAVTPHSRMDVFALLQATVDMREHYATCPIITISMGPLGTISRICGEAFGSCMTFGRAEEGSAPGQIDALNLAMILQILHNEE